FFLHEVSFVVIAKGTECGRAQFGSELAELYLERVESLQRADQVSHQSLRASATAALFRPRRAATARPHFCSGLFTSNSFLPDWMSSARNAPLPCRLSALLPSKLPLCDTLGLSPKYATTFLL